MELKEDADEAAAKSASDQSTIGPEAIFLERKHGSASQRPEMARPASQIQEMLRASTEADSEDARKAPIVPFFMKPFSRTETPAEESSRSKVRRLRLLKRPEKSEERGPTRNTGKFRKSFLAHPRSSRDVRQSREKPSSRSLGRSSSSQKGLRRAESFRRLSLPRSTSDRWHGSEGRQERRHGPRTSSRRWQADDYAPARQEDERELDFFFRFIDTCRKTALSMLRGIPTLISQLPEITMDLLKQLIPGLRRPVTPAIEPPHNEEETS